MTPSLASASRPTAARPASASSKSHGRVCHSAGRSANAVCSDMLSILLQQATKPNGDHGRFSGSRLRQTASQGGIDLGRIGDVLTVGADRFGFFGEIHRRLEVTVLETGLG